MNRLAFADSELRHLRDRLLNDVPNESAAVLLGGFSRRAGSTRLLIRETIVPEEGDYSTKEPSRLILKPQFIANVLKRARIEKWSLVLAHSHPFDHWPHFSKSDLAGEQLLMPTITARAADQPHGTLVLGKSGFEAHVWPNHLKCCTADRIDEIGSHVFYHWRDETEDLPVADRFERSVLAFGAEGQRTIERCIVGIVGLGGIGSIVAQELSYLGVRRFILIDPDTVDRTNLNRLVGALPSDVSRPKVEVVGQQIRKVQPGSQVLEVVDSVLTRSGGSHLLDADLIFSCTDTHGSRAILNQLAYQYYIPTIDVGIRIDAAQHKVTRITGRVQLLAPGLPCLICQNLLDSEQVRRDLLTEWERVQDPYIVGAAQPQPAVVSLNGTVASAAVTMMLAVVTGVPMNSRHQIFIGEMGTIRAIEGRRDPRCIVCSLDGYFGRGDQVPISWRQA